MSRKQTKLKQQPPITLLGLTYECVSVIIIVQANKGVHINLGELTMNKVVQKHDMIGVEKEVFEIVKGILDLHPETSFLDKFGDSEMEKDYMYEFHGKNAVSFFDIKDIGERYISFRIDFSGDNKSYKFRVMNKEREDRFTLIFDVQEKKIESLTIFSNYHPNDVSTNENIKIQGELLWGSVFTRNVEGETESGVQKYNYKKISKEIVDKINSFK